MTSTIFSIIILLWYFMTTCGSVFIAFLISGYIMNLVSIHNRIIRHIHTYILLTYVYRSTYLLHLKSWKVSLFVCLSAVFHNSVEIEICIKMGFAQKAAFLGLWSFNFISLQKQLLMTWMQKGIGVSWTVIDCWRLYNTLVVQTDCSVQDHQFISSNWTIFNLHN